MILRPLIVALAFASIALPQDLPGFRWAKQVDASGLNHSLAGLATDAAGNVYIAGTTSASHFPVKNALQPVMASAGLYRISGTSSTALGLSTCTALALDPQNPAQLYAVSNGALLKSVDGGATFTPVTLPATSVFSVAIEPGDDHVLYTGTYYKGVFKSVDGGGTWSAANSGLQTENDGSLWVQGLWIDPTDVRVIFAQTTHGFMRSADGAASWQPIALADTIANIAFDSSNAGTVYATSSHTGVFRSTDHGQTFATMTVPHPIGQVIPDPIQSGRLIGTGGAGIHQSTDGGATWMQESDAGVNNLVADPLNGVYYALSFGAGIVRISSDLQTVTPVSLGLPSSSTTALAVVNGQVYAASRGSTDVFVAKLDPSGNLLYSTYLGGNGQDNATAMTVDAAGNIFVTGTTNSGDFPVSKGAYASSGSVFLTRLNPDGSLGYSTYFSGTTPVAVATDGSGSAWLLGNSQGQLPVPPGVLAADFCCAPPGISIGPPIIAQDASLTRFSPNGSNLTFSTYVEGSNMTSPLGISKPATALALAPDGSAYVGGFRGIFHVDAAGSTLLSSTDKAMITPQAMALGPDGSLYAAGTPFQFQATPGAFQMTTALSGIVQFDATLSNLLAATSFGSSSQVKVMTTDAAGNIYVGGSTGTGLPARTPFAGAFASPTGFLSKLSGDLSALLFSSYFGDTNKFTVSGTAIGQNGDVLIGGVTNLTSTSPGSGDVWINSLALTPPPALRIDSVVNAASLVDGPISAGETIVIRGAGFGEDAQLLIEGTPVTPLSKTSKSITATVPADLPAAVALEVRSGGLSSNSVLTPVAVTSPGIFSQDGSGRGQGYILNPDGTLNSPSNPARMGDKVTIFATGVGSMTFTQCCAVTDLPANVYINNIYCNGVAAVSGPVSGFPGNVYRITVYVPDPAILLAGTGRTFVLPAQSAVALRMTGGSSQAGIEISIAQ